ncbi:GIY-YIG nuclease family protein [Peribacillus cavernae]|uniref:GIY-YIG nuclease family protein n=1 Tax=Peribacillus cavernae TaxID=1674310 RepID=A0A433HG69_9BACI|nr:GIY-YIG nuclease family protein [Peribacillus cavernae]MDQ0220915.1 putative endonuclease [Peribacillus cavernae]RUQ27270.1 GIY-YIG nuclease family protein [Peribacillus cavernae]
MENNEHFFYVLRCIDDSLYAGYTNNLEKRIKLHNEGKGAKYTRGRGPVELVYHEGFATKTEALQAEYRFKQLEKKEKEKFIIKEANPADVAAEKL